MKKNIDLRPSEFIRRREFYLPRFLFTLAVVFFIFAAGAASFFYYLRYLDYQLTLQVLQEDIYYLQEELPKFQELETEVRALEEYMALVKNLQDNAISWGDYLDTLWYTQPAGIWLQTIRANEPPRVSLEGEGRSLENIFSYVRVIEEFHFFEEVTLKALRREDHKYLFLIEAILKGVENPNESENTPPYENTEELEAYAGMETTGSARNYNYCLLYGGPINYCGRGFIYSPGP